MVHLERQRRNDRNTPGWKIGGLSSMGRSMITNTHSVGVVRDAVIAWKVKRGKPDMEGYCGLRRSLPRPGTATSTTSMASHVKPSTLFRRSTPPITDRWKKEALAAAQGWSAMNSKAGFAPRRECSPPKKAATLSAYWCSATTDSATSCVLPGFRWKRNPRWHNPRGRHRLNHRSVWPPMRH